MLKIISLNQKFHDGKLVLDNINLSISKDDFAIIAGENGAGKTVLVKHLIGLLKPTSGKIFLHGKSIMDNLLWTRQKIGMVFQNPENQFLGQTVEDDIAFGPRNLKLTNEEIEARVNKALITTSLSSLRKRSPHTLSGGEKRRLAIAGVLAMKPEIVIFDEPFSHLDYAGIKDLLKQILSLYKQGKTILIITHDLDKVLAHATKLIILNKGKMVLCGPPITIINEVEKYGVRKPNFNKDNLKDLTWLR